MPTLREYFLSEANESLSQLNELFARFDASQGDVNDLVRVARALRGSAQLAREHRVYRAALGLESAARALGAGQLQWNPDLSGRARRTVEDLQALANGEADDAADARLARALDRWRELGVQLPEEALTGAAPAAPDRTAASQQFREFAAHEAAGIAGEIDSSLAALAVDPKNRDALKAILRRQRALLGSARLDEIGVVAETLRAIEDSMRLIHKLNVAVKEEWVAVLKAARDVLASAVEPLRQGEHPKPTAALSKLRTLRAELLERYGAAEPANANPQPRDPMAATGTYTPPAAASAATVPPPAPAAAEATVVPIESLCYSGERALRRALELRPQLESIAGDNSHARESVDELFDLIRLGIA